VIGSLARRSLSGVGCDRPVAAGCRCTSLCAEGDRREREKKRNSEKSLIQRQGGTKERDRGERKREGGAKVGESYLWDKLLFCKPPRCVANVLLLCC
jgi:hypothetical protein